MIQYSWTAGIWTGLNGLPVVVLPTEGDAPWWEEERRRVMSANRSTEKEQVRVHIRWMIRRDMPEVLATETESCKQAWSEEDLLRCAGQGPSVDTDL